jgi:hypothetical protein
VLDPALIQELDAVPEFDRFATVDEIGHALARLAADHPDAAILRRIGTSRLGEPLLCLSIGDEPPPRPPGRPGDGRPAWCGGGLPAAVVFAMPHPNEPIGGLTTIHLARRLCADPDLRRSLGYAWHIVGCIDPDGTRLNEGWFAGPFTRNHYGRHFYRPAGDEQVEWTFPFAYKRAYFDRVMPETLALMRLIDDTRPAFMTSLHNAELGGAYYYLNRAAPALHPTLKALPRRYDVPLHLGEPEHPSLRSFDAAIFKVFDMTEVYDYVEELGQDPVAQVSGASSASYADRYGTFYLCGELPYWTDKNAADQRATATSYAELLRAQGRQLRELTEVLTGVLAEVAGDLVADSPFLRAVRYFTPSLRAIPEANDLRAAGARSDRPATIAECYSCQDMVHSFRIRYGGMLLRTLEGEIGIGNSTTAIRRHRNALAEIYDRWSEEAESAGGAEPIPIRHLVAIQYGAILAGARHAHSPVPHPPDREN